MTTYLPLFILRSHTGSVKSVAISNDKTVVATGSADTTIKIWNVATGALKYTLTGHTGLINSIAITSDSKKLISGSADTKVIIWDITTGTSLHTLT